MNAPFYKTLFAIFFYVLMISFVLWVIGACEGKKIMRKFVHSSSCDKIVGVGGGICVLFVFCPLKVFLPYIIPYIIGYFTFVSVCAWFY